MIKTNEPLRNQTIIGPTEYNSFIAINNLFENSLQMYDIFSGVSDPLASRTLATPRVRPGGQKVGHCLS